MHTSTPCTTSTTCTPAHLHQELVVKLPMSGDHKVFQLPKDVHKAARKTAKKGPVV